MASAAAPASAPPSALASAPAPASAPPSALASAPAPASAPTPAPASVAQKTVMQLQLQLTEQRLQLEQSRIDHSTLQSNCHRLETELSAARDALTSMVEERERTVGRYKCLLEQCRRDLNAKQDECDEYKLLNPRREELMRSDIYQKVEKLFRLKLVQMSADLQNARHDFNRVLHELSLCEAELDQEKRECVTAIEDLKRQHHSEMETERLRQKQCIESSSDLKQQIHQLQTENDRLQRKINDLKIQKSDEAGIKNPEPDATKRQQTKNPIAEQEIQIKRLKGERLRLDPKKKKEETVEGLDGSREEEQRNRLLNEIHELKADRNVLKRQLEELRTHFQLNLSDLRLEKETERNELERKVEELQQNLNVVNDELKALKTKTTIERHLATTLSQQLQTKLNAEWKNSNSLLNEKIELETKLEKLEGERLNKEEEEKRMMETMQERMRNAEQAKEEAEHQAETYRVQLESQQLLVNKMQSDYSSTFDLKLELSRLESDYQSILHDELAKVERLSAELHMAKEELIQSQTDWTADRQQMQKEIEDLRQELTRQRRQSINNLRFYKGRLKIWKIMEKKFKQNLEALRSDLSKLKVEKESTGYERPPLDSMTETRRQLCELIEKHRQFSSVLLPTTAPPPPPTNPGLPGAAAETGEGSPDISP